MIERKTERKGNDQKMMKVKQVLNLFFQKQKLMIRYFLDPVT